MKPGASLPRVPARLSSSLHHRLSLYAIAATAVSAGPLAVVPTAEAKIVYTPSHVIIGHGGVQRYGLDLNHDGVTDITFETFLGGCTDGCQAALDILLPPGNQFRGQKAVGGFYYVLALRPGVKIDSTRMLACRSFCEMAVSGTGAYGPRGKWRNVKNRYLGLRFTIKGKDHFGWARLSVAIKPNQVRATLTGYAYETIPNKPIITGKTKGTDVVTVQPASLGHLAIGASAIPAWRVKPTAATTH
jgi:hypothetical protein